MGAYLEHGLLSRRLLEVAVNFVARGEVSPIHRQQVFTLFHIHAGLRERRVELRVPILAIEYARKAVAAAIDRVVGAEQAHAYYRDVRMLAPGDVHMKN